MSATVTRLPTARTSYYEVRRCRRGWQVTLVTPPPAGGRAIRTRVGFGATESAAADYARFVAEKAQLPVRVLPAPGGQA